MARRRYGRKKQRRRNYDADIGSAGDFTRQVLDKYHVSSDVHAHQLITDWPAIVGQRVAARTTPMNPGAALADGVLSVRVINSAWLHELSFIKDQLRARINEFIGSKTNPQPIREIRFVHGRAPKGRKDELSQARAQQYRKPLQPRSLPAPARGERLEQIRRETAVVDDPELRVAIAEARRLLDV